MKAKVKMLVKKKKKEIVKKHRAAKQAAISAVYRMKFLTNFTPKYERVRNKYAIRATRAANFPLMPKNRCATINPMINKNAPILKIVLWSATRKRPFSYTRSTVPLTKPANIKIAVKFSKPT